MGYIRKILRFKLFKTTAIGLRCDREAKLREAHKVCVADLLLDLNLEPCGMKKYELWNRVLNDVEL